MSQARQARHASLISVPSCPEFFHFLVKVLPLANQKHIEKKIMCCISMVIQDDSAKRTELNPTHATKYCLPSTLLARNGTFPGQMEMLAGQRDNCSS
jgi:hypothetical protein